MNKNFTNYAGRSDVDDLLKAELTAAGIDPVELPFEQNTEVKTCIVGSCRGGWTFKRAWRYWVAEGPGIPPEYAEALHATHGQEVRVDGHGGAPSPYEWFDGFAVGFYHVDTPAGLKALADTLSRVRDDAKARHEAASAT